MANYQECSSFGDATCATCADLFPKSAEPVPGSDISINVPGATGPVTCPTSRWWLWLAIGALLGYAAND